MGFVSQVKSRITEFYHEISMSIRSICTLQFSQTLFIDLTRPIVIKLLEFATKKTTYVWVQLCVSRTLLRGEQEKMRYMTGEAVDLQKQRVQVLQLAV